MVVIVTTDPPAVILGGDDHFVDWPKLIYDFIDKQWNPQNTDSSKPSLYYAELSKTVMFRQGDHIVIYTVSAPEQPVTITYGWTNQSIIITLDMFTSRDRAHLTKMREECRRIIQLHRKDTVGPTDKTNVSGRHWMIWGIRQTPFEKTGNNFYRLTVDIEIKWRYREIIT